MSKEAIFVAVLSGVGAFAIIWIGLSLASIATELKKIREKMK